MSKELYIQSGPEGVDIALLDNKRLIELHHDDMGAGYNVGDIYLGRVKKMIPSLNAVFVDIGHERDSFLHYHDLGPKVRSAIKFVELARKGQIKSNSLDNFRLEPEIVKTGKINEVLQPGAHILVQVVKEPISTKGLRLSAQPSLSGRYIVLIPFSDSLSISKKIKQRADKERLRQIINSIRPRHFGVIIRTNAETASLEDLQTDLNTLMRQWAELVDALVGGERKLFAEADRAVSLMRDIVNTSFTRITVDSPALLKQVKGYLKQSGSGQEDIVKLYKGDKSLFEYSDVDRQQRSLLNKIVNLGGGAYLIIEHTEAMHVIDVNSGSKRSKQEDQEGNALKTNMEAATEIARQLRLRDMGGIVVIDFIDMRKSDNRKALYEHMREVMMQDRAKHTILPLTKFGIMQVTRQRVRQELNKDVLETCPVCNGTGEVARGVMITEDIRRKVEEMLKNKQAGKFVLHVHPLVHGYFTKGIINQRAKWFMKFGRWVGIQAHEHFSVNQYDILPVGEQPPTPEPAPIPGMEWEQEAANVEKEATRLEKQKQERRAEREGKAAKGSSERREDKNRDNRRNERSAQKSNERGNDNAPSRRQKENSPQRNEDNRGEARRDEARNRPNHEENRPRNEQQGQREQNRRKQQREREENNSARSNENAAAVNTGDTERRAQYDRPRNEEQPGNTGPDRKAQPAEDRFDSGQERTPYNNSSRQENDSFPAHQSVTPEGLDREEPQTQAQGDEGGKPWEQREKRRNNAQRAAQRGDADNYWQEEVKEREPQGQPQQQAKAEHPGENIGHENEEIGGESQLAEKREHRRPPRPRPHRRPRHAHHNDHREAGQSAERSSADDQVNHADNSHAFSRNNDAPDNPFRPDDNTEP